MLPERIRGTAASRPAEKPERTTGPRDSILITSDFPTATPESRMIGIPASRFDESASTTDLPVYLKPVSISARSTGTTVLKFCTTAWCTLLVVSSMLMRRRRTSEVIAWLIVSIRILNSWLIASPAVSTLAWITAAAASMCSRTMGINSAIWRFAASPAYSIPERTNGMAASTSDRTAGITCFAFSCSAKFAASAVYMMLERMTGATTSY
mmetsp:Transcript_17618/g.53308  ORF Transcript_17618/g.53308 Transcript_17618/m.53308 type:complete len:210 (+) Transcript_17618:454-1083(+)